MKKNRVIGGLLGLCIGDLLGVPLKFKSRNILKLNPVKDIIGYGTHNQPPGTVAINLLQGNPPTEAYERMKSAVLEYYSKRPYVTELQNFGRIIESDISELPEKDIKSSGYVIDTLEASL